MCVQQLTLLAFAEIFYNEDEARKYTNNSRMIEIQVRGSTRQGGEQVSALVCPFFSHDLPASLPLQSRLTERAVELLALPQDGAPKMLLDIGCGSGLSGEQLTELVGGYDHEIT